MSAELEILLPETLESVPCNLCGSTAGPDHPAVNLVAVQFLNLFEQSPHKIRPGGNLSTRVLTGCLLASLIITSPSLGLAVLSPPGGRGESQESVGSDSSCGA